MVAPRQDSSARLADLLVGLVSQKISTQIDRPVLGLALDSRCVQPGDLFMAVAGQRVQGKQFIQEAITKGATAVLFDAESHDMERATSDQIEQFKTADGRRVPIVPVSDLNRRIGVIADLFYGHPSHNMFVTGITGTNGKTSCCHYLAYALNQDKPCGVIGTLGYGLYGDLQAAVHTTPDAVRCHKALADMWDQGAASAILEVSSHALDQSRINGIAFDCAVFTNLTREHLDYHGDMQSYGGAKRSLFTWPRLKYAVINADDPFASELQGVLSKDVEVVTYAVQSPGMQSQSAVISSQQLELDEHGLAMQINTPWGNQQLQAPLLGRFNASNLLAVLAVMLLRNIPLDVALQRLTKLPSLDGRMQRLGGVGQALVVVDYAHTPDALKQALSALREHCQGSLWCVFGCGGNRDVGKRPEMGAVVEQYADHIVLSNDNPRHEDPNTIIKGIQSGLHHPEAAHVIMDRGEAIRTTIARSKVGDIVLVAGKGHESYQQIGELRRPFSDAIQVRRALGCEPDER